MSTHGVTIPRVTVNFSGEQMDWLNDTAHRRSASVSDIIRRLIDETRGAYLTPKQTRLGGSSRKHAKKYESKGELHEQVSSDDGGPGGDRGESG